MSKFLKLQTAVVLVAYVFIEFFGCTSSVKILEIIVPSHVYTDDHVVLTGKFDIEGDTGYSVKWYKNGGEFVRYSPILKKCVKIFETEDFKVLKAECENDNICNVILGNMTEAATGFYTFEISEGGPMFKVQMNSRAMAVRGSKLLPPAIKWKSLNTSEDEINITCYTVAMPTNVIIKIKVNDEEMTPVTVVREIVSDFPYNMYETYAYLTLIEKDKYYKSSDDDDDKYIMKVSCQYKLSNNSEVWSPLSITNSYQTPKVSQRFKLYSSSGHIRTFSNLFVIPLFWKVKELFFNLKYRKN